MYLFSFHRIKRDRLSQNINKVTLLCKSGGRNTFVQMAQSNSFCFTFMLILVILIIRNYLKFTMLLVTLMGHPFPNQKSAVAYKGSAAQSDFRICKSIFQFLLQCKSDLVLFLFCFFHMLFLLGNFQVFMLDITDVSLY